MIRKKVMTAIALLFTASLILTFAGVTSAIAQSPILPDSFYGSSLTVNAGSAPAGVTLVAKIAGVERGRYVTEQVGRYGYLGAGQPKLLVEGTSDDIGKEIQFYIENYDGTLTLASNNPTPTFESGADPQEVDLIFAGVQLQAPAPSEGAGAAPASPPTVETNLFGTTGSFEISDDGEVQESFTATSADGQLTLTIPEGTKALDKDGEPLESLEAAVDASPPDPPEYNHIIGLTYDFGPDEATFDPPITFIWTYDPDDLPEDVDEKELVVAYYDESADEWVELDCEVDTENGTITASVSHFTTFAILGTTKIAAFTITLVDISPTEVAPGEEVTVTVSVANNGTKEGRYTLVLEINGVKEEDNTVTVPAGESEVASFITTREQPGKYNVMVEGLGGSFTVVAPSVTPETPAKFSLSKLTVTPTEVESNEPVTVTVSVANTGGTEGSYRLVLKINNVKEAEQSVTVDAGKSKVITFTVSKQVAGSYSVEINGLTGSFTVVEAAPPTTSVTPPGPEPTNWPLIGGIIGGTIVVGLAIFFLVRRRVA